MVVVVGLNPCRRRWSSNSLKLLIVFFFNYYYFSPGFSAFICVFVFAPPPLFFICIDLLMWVKGGQLSQYVQWRSDGVHVVVHCPFSVALLDIEMSSAILKGHWLMKQRPTPPFTALTLNLHVEIKCDDPPSLSPPSVILLLFCRSKKVKCVTFFYWLWLWLFFFFFSFHTFNHFKPNKSAKFKLSIWTAAFYF